MNRTQAVVIVALLGLCAIGLAVAFTQCAGQAVPATGTPGMTATPATPGTAAATAPPDSTPQPAPEDDVPMVRVPAGEFIMGSRYEDALRFMQQWHTWRDEVEAQLYPPDYFNETPQRTLYLQEFYIDKYKVTNARYLRCVQAGACRPPQHSPYYDDPAYAESPVVRITWKDADTFCRWAGKRLPAETEWEKAARGTDGRLWPWGNEWDESQVYGSRELTSVGSFPANASPYGVMDMVGRVQEWVADWYLPYPGTRYESEDFGQTFKVIRGGIFRLDLGADMRTTNRLYVSPDTSGHALGFRCVRDGPLPTPEPTYTPEPTSTPDTAERDMVLVPAGEFLMGDNAGDPDAQPEHTVYLDAFYIDKYEVTNAQYAAFLNEYGQNRKACEGVDCASVDYEKENVLYYKDGQFRVGEGFEDMPAGFVSWYGADAYCRHYGMRLPAEAEWEKAARGTDGRKWPWGNEWDPDKVANASYRPVDPLPVGSKPEGASPYGLLDMIGNVNEWTNDWYAAGYYAQSPYRNPPGPDTGIRKVLRGGGSLNTRTDLWDRIAGTARRVPSSPISLYGFRCAYSVIEEDK